MYSIKVIIKDKESIYEKYSHELSSDLVEYLVKEAMLKKDFQIEITSVVKIANLENLIIEGLKNSYNKLIFADKIYDVKQIIFTCIGIIFLIMASFLKTELFHELLLIAGWVAIWEVIDFNLNQDILQKRRKKALKKLIDAKIVIK